MVHIKKLNQIFYHTVINVKKMKSQDAAIFNKQ